MDQRVKALVAKPKGLNWKGSRREPIPASCPMISTHALPQIMHTYMINEYSIIKVAHRKIPSEFLCDPVSA